MPGRPDSRFLYAGAQRVVASLWQVDDLAPPIDNEDHHLPAALPADRRQSRPFFYHFSQQRDFRDMFFTRRQ